MPDPAILLGSPLTGKTARLVQAYTAAVLAGYGLPVAPPVPAARQTPLVRAGLLALRWIKSDPGAETERDLLALPFIGLDPFDLDLLWAEARRLEKSILDLAEAEMHRLTHPAETLAVLARVRAGLQSLIPYIPADREEASRRRGTESEGAPVLCGLHGEL